MDNRYINQFTYFENLIASETVVTVRPLRSNCWFKGRIKSIVIDDDRKMIGFIMSMTDEENKQHTHYINISSVSSIDY